MSTAISRRVHYFYHIVPALLSAGFYNIIITITKIQWLKELRSESGTFAVQWISTQTHGQLLELDFMVCLVYLLCTSFVPHPIKN